MEEEIQTAWDWHTSTNSNLESMLLDLPSFTVLPPTLPSYSFPEGIDSVFDLPKNMFGYREKEYIYP